MEGLKQFTNVKPANPSGHSPINWLKGAVKLINEGDFRPALCLLEASVKQEFPDTHFHLGVMYMESKGVEQNVEKAMEHFNLALKLNENGKNTSKWLNAYNHGYLYEKGYGVVQNYYTAFSLYGLSATGNDSNPLGDFAKGFLIERGLHNSRGKLNDAELANVWYKEALRKNLSRNVLSQDQITCIEQKIVINNLFFGSENY